MPIITWITSNVFEFVMIVGLAAVIILLATLIKTQRTPLSATLSVDIENNVEGTLQRVFQSVGHAADVSAVLGLMDQLADEPDALQLLESYPATVRAAAWLHYINTLGSDLQHAQQVLSDEHTGKYRHGTTYQPNIDAAQKQVNSIRSKLDAAIEASGKSRLRSV